MAAESQNARQLSWFFPPICLQLVPSVQFRRAFRQQPMGSIISFLFDFDIESDDSQTNVPLFSPSASINQIGKPNLETFSLLWCDADVEKVCSSRAMQEKLLDLISFQRTFTSIDECDQYIGQQTKSIDKIILICSGSFAQQLLGRVHALPQIMSVYIYCFHKENYQQLHSQFAKVGDQARENITRLLCSISGQMR